MRFRIRMFNVLLEFKGFLMVHVKTIMFIIIVIIYIYLVFLLKCSMKISIKVFCTLFEFEYFT